MLSNWFIRLLCCLFLMTMSTNLIRPMVSYRALELGADTAEIGLLAASYAILSFLVAVPTGQWVDRFGEMRFAIVGGSAMVLVSAWMWLAESLLGLGAAQAVLGGGQILGLVALQTLVANCSPGDQRDARFGAFAFVASVGQILGPTAGGLIATSVGGGPRTALLAAALPLTGFIVLAVSLYRWPPPQNDHAGRPPRADAVLPAMLRLLRLQSMPQAMIASLTVLATVDLLIAYVPVYGEANGLSVTTVGLLLSTRAAAGAASRLVMIPMLRALGRRRLFVGGLLLPAIALSMTPLTASVPLLLLVMAVAGFGLGLGQPMSLAWVTTIVPSDSRGIAIGIRLMGNRAGQIALPAAIGALGGLAGVASIFVMLGVMLAGSATAVTTAVFEDDPP